MPHDFHMNDYYLGTPEPIPRLWRITAWTIAVINLVLVFGLGLREELVRVIAVDACGLFAVLKPEMFEDSERYDLMQQRWLRTVLSEETVWYVGWLVLLLPIILIVSAMAGTMMSTR